jgi:7-cyano-7-deazaguanine synthase in queuosine biosynthesis
MNYLLFSGGLDSTILFHRLVKTDNVFTSVFLDYGQQSLEEELRVVKNYCDLYHVPLITYKHKIELDNDFYYKGRNLYLVAVIATFCNKGDTIFIGVNTSDDRLFPDCRKEFISGLKNALWSGYSINLETPLLDISKRELKAEGSEFFVSYCYTPVNGSPCGKCISCLEHNK